MKLLFYKSSLNLPISFANIKTKFQFAGHNIREFDIPFLCRRMIINQIQLPAYLHFYGAKPWEISMVDTLQWWKFGDYKNYTSLHLLASVFWVFLRLKTILMAAWYNMFTTKKIICSASLTIAKKMLLWWHVSYSDLKIYQLFRRKIFSKHVSATLFSLHVFYRLVLQLIRTSHLKKIRLIWRIISFHFSLD